MTLPQAREFAYAVNWTMADFRKAYNLLIESGTKEDIRYAMDLEEGIPYFFCYDDNGNWVGEV